MYRDHTVAVVVPAYNEEGLVGTVIDTMPPFVDRVYAIDDASADGTWAEIRRHSERANARRSPPEKVVADGGGPDNGDPDDRFVVPLRHEDNAGRGRCVKDGYRMAYDAGFDVVAVMDGDGQMDPAVLDTILDPVVSEEAAYAKGTRLQDRAHVAGMSRWRLFGNLLLSFLTNLSSGYWGMADSQNGYTAISRKALETIPIEDLYDGYGFLNDILTTLNIHGFRIAEVPHPAVYDEEESGIEYTSFVPRVSGLLLSNFLHRMHRQYVSGGVHATVVCYVAGIVAFVVGVLNGVSGLLTGGVALVAALPTAVILVAAPLLLLLGVALDVQQNRGLAYRSDTRTELQGQ
jgi:glycosyltransferase involved in cell wall biosynthesis